MIERITRRKPIPRKSAPPKTNAKRKAREFKRTYHSTARVKFVKSLPCCVCGGDGSVNAHTTGGGMSRKGDFTTIVPLCHVHHVQYDEYLWPLGAPAIRWHIASNAADVEALWLRHCGEGE